MPLLDCYLGCVAAFIAVKFRSTHAGSSCGYLSIKVQENFNVSCFCLTKQKGSVVLILLALRSNSFGLGLIIDGTLSAGIRES